MGVNDAQLEGCDLMKVVAPQKKNFATKSSITSSDVQGRPQGGKLEHFVPGPSLKGAPGGPMKGPLNTCFKDRCM